MRMTKMELMRRPSWPLYSLPESTGAEGQHVSATFVWWDDALGRRFIQPGPHGRGRLTALNGYTATRIFGRHGESGRGLPCGHNEGEILMAWSAGTLEDEDDGEEGG